MADAIARKYIEIVADGSKAIKSLQGIEEASKRSQQSLSTLQRQAKNLGNALIGYLSFRAVQGLVSFSDTARDTTVRLKAATGSAAEFENVFQDLLVIGNKTGTSIDVLASSFAKLKVSVPIATTEDIVAQLDLVSTAMATTGKSTQQVNAVFLQLSQALSSGALQGDEFRAVYENAPELLRAWQEAAGLTDQNLRTLSSTAQLTAQSFFENINAIKAITENMIGLTEPPLTVARALNVLKNNLTEAYVTFEEAVPIFTGIAVVIKTIGENLDVLALALVAVGTNFAIIKLQAAYAGSALATAAASTNLATAAFVRFKTAALAAVASLSAFGPAIAVVTGYALGSWINEQVEGLEEVRKAYKDTQALRERAGTIADALVTEEDVDVIKHFMGEIRDTITATQEQIAGGLTVQNRPGGLTDYQIQEIIKLQNQIATLEEEYERLGKQIDNINSKSEDLGKSFDEVSEYINGLNNKVRVGEERMLAFATGGEKAATAVDNVQEQFDAYNKVLDIFKTSMAGATEVQLGYAQAALDATTALQKQAEATEQLNEYNSALESIESIITSDAKPSGAAGYIEILTGIGAATSALRSSGNIEAAQEALEKLTGETKDFSSEATGLSDKFRTEDLAARLKELADSAYPDRAATEEESFAQGFAQIVSEAQALADNTDLQLKVTLQDEELIVKLGEQINGMQAYADANPVVINVQAEVDDVIAEEADEVGGQV